MTRLIDVSRYPMHAVAVGLAVLAGSLAPALAHEGHDHDEPAQAAADAAPSSPRFAAAGDAFELVGALDGRRLVLWLDRLADNAPVTGARLELDIAGRARLALPQGEAYVAELDAPLPAGRSAIVATVTVGAEADLIAAELDVPDAARLPAGADAPRGAASAVGLGLWTGAAIAAVAGLLGWAIGRRPGAGGRA